MDPLSRLSPRRPLRESLGESVQELLERVSRRFRGIEGGSPRTEYAPIACQAPAAFGGGGATLQRLANSSRECHRRCPLSVNKQAKIGLKLGRMRLMVDSKEPLSVSESALLGGR